MSADYVAPIKAQFIISSTNSTGDDHQEKRSNGSEVEANSKPVGVKSEVSADSTATTDLSQLYDVGRLVTNKANAPGLDANEQSKLFGAYKSAQSLNGDETDVGRARMDVKGKLYLAPLSKLGALPFRRICVDFGADITCSKMVRASDVLKEDSFDWTSVMRHSSEKYFGVQLCGASADEMSKAAQLLLTKIDVDFLDINAACPRKAICAAGAGCALMEDTNRLGDIVKAMRSVMNDMPLTIKFRKGMQVDNDLALEFLKVVKTFDIDLITMHGRTKEQPDTELSDWAYVGQCAKAVHPLPLAGVGDVLSYTDYYHNLDTYSVAAVTIARGAMIKPWLFTEIREKRHWDIDASERLEILKRFVKYGLDHWGSDQHGVNRTRDFLLEWMSFLYRYIPVGLLEYLPQRMVDRFPRYYGRNDLETLMASDRVDDWIKISEMLLGPAPDGFQFVPKHKPHCYL